MTELRNRALVIGINFSPEPTGIGPYTAGLVDMLSLHGWDVDVITTLPHYPAWKLDSARKRSEHERLANGASVHRVVPDIPRKLTQIARVRYEIAFGIRAALRRWQSPDVVILVSPALFASATALFKARIFARKIRVVVWVQDFYSLGVQETQAGGGLSARLIGGLESFLLRKADDVIVIHDRFANHAAKGLGVNANRLTVIRNWTHVEQANVDREGARAKFGWTGRTVILHAGNMGAKQGLENVIAAARLADAAESSALFVLLGGGNRREALLDAAADVDRVVFMDSLNDSDFVAAMHAADVLLVNELPGVQEMAVPSKLTSYYSSGRPVLVASDAGSITSEEIETSGGGVRVDAGNPQALLEAAEQLGSDAAMANTLGALGHRFQRDVLSVEHATRAFVNILGRGDLAARGRTEKSSIAAKD